METGRIKILIEEGKTPSVEAELVNGTLWMPKWKIAQLFNCFNQKIEANLRSIFSQHLLWEEDVTCNYRYTNNKGIECQIRYYNMEVLIFLSYRIHSLEAKVFRQFVNSALREQLKKGKTPKQSVKIIWLYSPKLNYLWN